MVEDKIIKYNNRKTGSAYERRAAEYLQSQGVKIIEMNYRLKIGEIDIIGRDKNTYIFVEVKYRKSASHGTPEEAVNYKKQRTICRIATLYRKFKKLPDKAGLRFDVVAILDDRITWYKNAFFYHI